MAGELVTAQAGSAISTVRGARPQIMEQALKDETEQRKLLMEYVSKHMVEGTDYGAIPGTRGDKCLLKPGAEKLTDLFRCIPEYEIVERVEDFDRPMFHYLFRCRIISRDTGAIVAEGFGSCNSREAKYRWRNADRTCPHCGQTTIIKGKSEWGGGWLCFARKGGCGAKFHDQDTTITGQQVGRVENPDAADSANTILKMAKKRAQVDAVIALARCSEMFTQDIEDFQNEAEPAVAKPAARPIPKTQAEIAAGMQKASPRDSLELFKFCEYAESQLRAAGSNQHDVLGHVGKTYGLLPEELHHIKADLVSEAWKQACEYVGRIAAGAA